MDDIRSYNEKKLLQRVAGGDEKAFDMFFNLYKGKIFAYAYKLSKSRHIAEEIVQEIFIKLWINREQLREVNNPGTYIFVMVKNKVIDYLRKIANEDGIFTQVWKFINAQQDTADKVLDAKESQGLINVALGQLSTQKRKIFLMSRSEGLSHREIAEKLSLSVSSVKNHIVETLSHIKSFLR
jgi:RNA polymerase sigma-70 factor (family 1)